MPNLIDMPHLANDAQALYRIVQAFILFFIILSVVFFLALVAIIAVLIKMRLADDSQKETAEYASHVLNAQEEERSRISAELHDTVAQDLKAAVTFLESDKPVCETRDLLLKCITQIRSMCYSLVPPELSGQSLSSALHSLCYNFKNKTGFEVSFFFKEEASRLLDSNFLSDLQKLSIYRIVQESLTNIQKHAGTCEVSVFARKDYKNERGGLYLYIEDDGRGFTPENLLTSDKSSHFGLKGMKMRAAQTGGTLSVFSEPGLGTRILLFIPIGVFEK